VDGGERVADGQPVRKWILFAWGLDIPLNPCSIGFLRVFWGV
jgi:hypothetical protein